MVSKTGKTQVPNNSIGIYCNMNKYTSNKIPLCISMPHKFYFRSRQLLARLIFCSTISFSIIIGPCLNKSGKDIWGRQWPDTFSTFSIYGATINFISRAVTDTSRAVTVIYTW